MSLVEHRRLVVGDDRPAPTKAWLMFRIRAAASAPKVPAVRRRPALET
jgi:hypothetical protein